MAARHYPLHQIFDSSGNPLSGGTISGYIANTTTPILLYTNRADAQAGTNGSLALSLPADGSVIIWFDDATKIKLVIKDSSGAVIPNGTIDYISGEFDLTSSSLVLGGVLNLSQGTNIASAATTNIASATGNYVIITGTTTITALGTVQAGAGRLIEFQSSLTLTHNATSLILPASTSITTVAGDMAHMLSLGSGNWKCVSYFRKDGEPLLMRASANIASASTVDLSTATGDFVNITGTTTITSFGTVPAGVIKQLKIASVLSITYNATSMIIPGAVSYTTSAGDVLLVLSLGSGNWQIISVPVFVVDGGNINKIGADIASATSIDLSTATGNYMIVTGSVTITSLGTVAAGVRKRLRFTGGAQLTHNATSLILLGSVSTGLILSNTEIEFISLGSGNWREISRNLPNSAMRDDIPLTVSAGDAGKFWRVSNTGLASGSTRVWTLPDSDKVSTLIQRTSTQTGAVATGTTLLPYDDTIPQNTEGDQYMTLSVTPKNALNKLCIDVGVLISNSGSVNRLGVALFQDATANAIASMTSVIEATAASSPQQLLMCYEMAAGTTSATTFKVRAGANDAGTTTFNGSAGGRKHGGVLNSFIRITEYSA